MLKIPSNASSKLAGFAGVLLTALVGGLFLAPAAFAHHPTVTGTADCGDTITFTSTAWTTSSEAQRTNPEIEIGYIADGGSYVALPSNPAYRYDSANGFQFSDTFTPPAGWSSVVLRATAVGDWGSGASGGDMRTSAPITPQTDCEPPVASIADAECSDEGAVVRLTNPGDAPVEFTITGGEDDQVVTVAAGDTEDVTVELQADEDSTITVSADGMDDVSREVSYHCASAEPSATTADATCLDGGAVVHLVNPGDAPAEFTISVPGMPDVVTTVPAGEDADVTVPTPDGVTTTITVTAPGMTAVVTDVTYECASGTGSGALPAAEESGGGNPGSEGEGGGNPVSPAPATDVASGTATVPLAAELPRTGSTTSTLLVVALCSLLVGVALVFGERRAVRGRGALQQGTVIAHHHNVTTSRSTGGGVSARARRSSSYRSGPMHSRRPMRSTWRSPISPIICTGRAQSSRLTSTPSSRSAATASSALGPGPGTSPCNARQYGAIHASGCTAVSSTTTRRRACDVSASMNGARSSTL